MKPRLSYFCLDCVFLAITDSAVRFTYCVLKDNSPFLLDTISNVVALLVFKRPFHVETYTNLHSNIICNIFKKWKQLKSLSTDEEMSKIGISIWWNIIQQ